MQTNKIKVLYIAGYGRSGSTILHNVLGEVEGFFGVGEVNRIWDLGLIENRPCGCSVPFRECEFWRNVLDDSFGGIGQIDIGRVLEWRRRSRTRYLPLVMVPFGDRLLTDRLKKFSEYLAQLYQSIQVVTGCRVIIDNSKSLVYAHLLKKIPSIDLSVIHLVRDPHGVLQSLLERNERRCVPILRRYNCVRNSIVWDSVNVATEFLCKFPPTQHIVIRYETFIRKPRDTLERIFELVQEKESHLPLMDSNKIGLGITHTVTGRNRFRQRLVELQEDTDWEAQMNWINRTVVNILTWPVCTRYGYSSNLVGKS